MVTCLEGKISLQAFGYPKVIIACFSLFVHLGRAAISSGKSFEHLQSGRFVIRRFGATCGGQMRRGNHSLRRRVPGGETPDGVRRDAAENAPGMTAKA